MVCNVLLVCVPRMGLTFAEKHSCMKCLCATKVYVISANLEWTIDSLFLVMVSVLCNFES